MQTQVKYYENNCCTNLAHTPKHHRCKKANVAIGTTNNNTILYFYLNNNLVTKRVRWRDSYMRQISIICAEMFSTVNIIILI